MALADNIRKMREAKGLTQEELGKLCGTTKQAIQKYEYGTVTNIPLDRVQAIANVLGTTPADLLGWKKEISPLVEEISGILSDMTPEQLNQIAAYIRFIKMGG